MYLADMGLQRGVYSEMASDVVPFGAGSSAILPLASETEVVCALATDVLVAEMVVEGLWVGECLGAVLPLALLGVDRLLWSECGGRVVVAGIV
jgi:hypothetical protein